MNRSSDFESDLLDSMGFKGKLHHTFLDGGARDTLTTKLDSMASDGAVNNCSDVLEIILTKEAEFIATNTSTTSYISDQIILDIQQSPTCQVYRSSCKNIKLPASSIRNILHSFPMTKTHSEPNSEMNTPTYIRKFTQTSRIRSLFRGNRIQDVSSESTLRTSLDVIASSHDIQMGDKSARNSNYNLSCKQPTLQSTHRLSEARRLRVQTKEPYELTKVNLESANESILAVKDSLTSRLGKSRYVMGASVDEMSKNIKHKKPNHKRAYSADIETRIRRASLSSILETSHIAKKASNSPIMDLNGDIEKVQGKVNQYYLLRDIGSGSFGKVILAKHEQTGKYFACKTISKNRLRKKFRFSAKSHQKADEIMAEIKREVAILKQLPKHPKIVNLVEVLDDSAEDELFLCIKSTDF